MSFKDVTVASRRSRSAYKGKITFILNDLQKKFTEKTLTSTFLQKQEQVIDKYLEKINNMNEEIEAICNSNEIELDNTDRQNDLQEEGSYQIKVQEKLCNFVSKKTKATVSTSDDTAQSRSFNIRPPRLQCKTFSGTDLQDKFSFKNFLSQFDNVIDSIPNITDSAKLTYLRSFLSDYAFTIISHLSISDENFDVAIDLLKAEFLDEEFIVEEHFKKIISSQPKYDPDFNNVKSYLNEMRAIVHDLQTYSLDFLNPKADSAGLKLLSHIIFNKLPSSLRRELMHKTKSNYPSLIHIFENYQDVIKTLIRASSNQSTRAPKHNFKSDDKPRSDLKDSSVQNKSYNEKLFTKSPPEGAAALQNFSTQSSTSKTSRKPCKFCSSQNHVMYNCDKYANYDSRQHRCLELKLCTLCSSPNHVKHKCPGRNNSLQFECLKCKNKTHISTLCKFYENHKKDKKTDETSSFICMNSNISKDTEILMPLIDLNISSESKLIKVTCFLDNACQRSYFNNNVLNNLEIPDKDVLQTQQTIKTFLGSGIKDLKEIPIGIGKPGIGYILLKV